MLLAQAGAGPLSSQEDCLQGIHANTQIPKLIGLAKEYELTNDTKRRATVEFFGGGWWIIIRMSLAGIALENILARQMA